SILLQTLFIHIGLDRPFPEWAKNAFLRAYVNQPEHWDDVFGRPEGPQLKEEVHAYLEGTRLRTQGRPIGNDGFFDEIGKKIRKSAGTAKRRRHSPIWTASVGPVSWEILSASSGCRVSCKGLRWRVQATLSRRCIGTLAYPARSDGD